MFALIFLAGLVTSATADKPTFELFFGSA